MSCFGSGRALPCRASLAWTKLGGVRTPSARVATGGLVLKGQGKSVCYAAFLAASSVFFFALLAGSTITRADRYFA
jgi:hypothetical protein